jgi:hypothetical protein
VSDILTENKKIGYRWKTNEIRSGTFVTFKHNEIFETTTKKDQKRPRKFYFSGEDVRSFKEVSEVNFMDDLKLESSHP